MMKKAFLAVSSLVLFACCKENNPQIDFTHRASTGTDTTYVMTSGIPTSPDPHNVLIEEFSGQSCSNCPAAHTVLVGLEGGGNVNVVSLYITNFSQTTPPSGYHYDLRSTVATSISDAIYGTVGAMPTGGVDRTLVSGDILLNKNQWASAVTTQKAVIDPLNLRVESSYSGGTATITATVTYLSPLTTKQNLSVVIVEDSMVDIQETATGYDNSYVFTSVFREMLTSAPLGDPILDTLATKERGRVFVRKFTYTPKVVTPAIVPARCRVIAFVNAPGGTGGDYRVLQSWKVNLVP